MYTNDKNAQIVIALLKKYNIKKIVVSPGVANVQIARSVQIDSFFEVYSVVDERSAAYFATGLAFESGEPVAISCTGATASRNYLSALTEAYYRNLPIIAITSSRDSIDYDGLKPQSLDRTTSQNDVKRISVDLPVIKDKEDEQACVLATNKALSIATKTGGGPVHLNLKSESLIFNSTKLPEPPKIDYYHYNDLLFEKIIAELKEELKDKKIGLLIGAHKKFLTHELNAIEKFIDSYDVAIFCEHTSSYSGKNKIMAPILTDIQDRETNADIIIDIGSVFGHYGVVDRYKKAKIWRISEDGKIVQRSSHLNKQFECSEYMFFSFLSNDNCSSDNEYYNSIRKSIDNVKIIELPLSNTFVSSQISKKLPKGSSLHLGILNSLRNMNYFDIDNSIDCSCNVGGYGIDGAVSTLIGQSMTNAERLYFGQIGDLAFFYDMNALGIRHIKNNIRLLVINNGRGVEFRVNSTLESQFGDTTDKYIAAEGHFGSAEAWAKSMGFEYISAHNKDEFMKQVDSFCSPDINEFDKPVFFEVFTTVKDEQTALNSIRNINRFQSKSFKSQVKQFAKIVMPSKIQNAIKQKLNKN